MPNPLVSVIIPAYNGELFLAETLRSVLAQDYRPFEVIVVDDGSTDQSAAVAQGFSKVRYIHQTNQGHAAAKNAGIAVARGEYLAFLDADDLWAVNKLSLQMSRLLECPEIGYTISHRRLLFEPGVEPPTWMDARYLSEQPAFIPSALVVRRSVMDAVGHFDRNYWHCNDSDWFFRANDAGVRKEIVREPLLLRRIHAANLSNQRRALLAEEMRLVRASIKRKQAARGEEL